MRAIPSHGSRRLGSAGTACFVPACQAPEDRGEQRQIHRSTPRSAKPIADCGLAFGQAIGTLSAFACLLSDSVDNRPCAERIDDAYLSFMDWRENFPRLSLTMFVGAMIAIFGDQLRMGSHRQSGHVGASRSLPNTGAFRLPTLDPPQLGPSRIVERARLARAESVLAPCLAPAMADDFSRKGPARAAIGRRAA
jgi:hypothetical protein